MADKMRSINTKFWDDSFIQDLNPTEKLLFLYLLTNPLTNLLGIYEITLKRISFDTGLNKDVILKGLERFGMVKKVYYRDNFIIIPNFLKNQNLNKNMKIGVTNLFCSLPNDLKDSILSNGSQSVSNDYKTILNSLLKYEIEIESEKEEESKEEIDIPSFNDFKTYALDNKKDIDLQSLELKYKSWVENNWKDGNNKKIINWKSKLLNTLQYIKDYGYNKQPDSRKKEDSDYD